MIYQFYGCGQRIRIIIVDLGLYGLGSAAAVASLVPRSPWAPEFLNHDVGGWDIDAMYRYQAGAPLAFGNVILSGS
jgi:hypothetical protein